MDEIDAIEDAKGWRLRPHSRQRERLIERMDVRDSRNRPRGITCAKRRIRELGYSIRESNDSYGRYCQILSTSHTRQRNIERNLERAGIDPDEYYQRQAHLLVGQMRESRKKAQKCGCA